MTTPKTTTSINQTTPVSNWAIWTGRILSAIVILFLLFDGSLKVMELDIVKETGAQLGLPAHLNFGLGVLAFIIVALYAVPRTSILGAILLTGLLGGAIATHLRVGSPLFTHTLFPVYLGLIAWGGLFLRDDRLRALIPLRR